MASHENHTPTSEDCMVLLPSFGHSREGKKHTTFSNNYYDTDIVFQFHRETFRRPPATDAPNIILHCPPHSKQTFSILWSNIFSFMLIICFLHKGLKKSEKPTSLFKVAFLWWISCQFFSTENRLYWKTVLCVLCFVSVGEGGWQFHLFIYSNQI